MEVLGPILKLIDEDLDVTELGIRDDLDVACHGSIIKEQRINRKIVI